MFQKLSCVEDIAISETMFSCNVIRVKFSEKHVLILYENFVKVGDTMCPNLPRFWELILYSEFVLMSYSSFITKVVMIG